ncbi:MAG: sigma-54 dependent transcriptional regulator [Blastocatellia bacterium]|nr:sigma-54 dependent transcriptional regulator [Blastocatellia bacterium]
MGRGSRVLIVDDDAEFRSVLTELMRYEGHQIWVAASLDQAKGFLAGEKGNGFFDLIVTDMMLGDGTGLEVLNAVREVSQVVPVIFVTAFGSMETVAEAIRQDVFDYVAKPFDAAKLLEVVRQALAKPVSPDGTGLEVTDEVIGPLRIIGSSPAMVNLYKAVARVSRTDSTIFISGESGTGKELVARAIHTNSTRSHRPFVAVNCGAFSETLLESELFGHARGSFTGAHQSRQGLFESASGGTIFLDEISETSMNFQVKLLRVLQEHRVRPIGANEERRVDIRLVAATNRSLRELLQSSDFRRDLLYRLSVINLRLPALRERREDIPLLVEYFIQKFSVRQKKALRLAPGTLDWLTGQSWPGNVRELEHAVERAVTLNVSGELIVDDFVQFSLFDDLTEPTTPEADPPETGQVASWVCILPKTLDEVEREHIRETLAFAGGNKVRAAEMLGIGRWSLYRKAKRLGLRFETEDDLEEAGTSESADGDDS